MPALLISARKSNKKGHPLEVAFKHEWLEANHARVPNSTVKI